MNPTYPLLLLVALLSLAPRLEAADYRIYSEQQRQEKIELLTGPASVGRQSRFEQVIEQMNMLSDKAAFLDVIDIGGAVFRKASAEHDDRLQMYMATYIGYACMFTGRLDSMRLYLDTALQMGLAAKDRFTVARVYNAEGIFRLTVEQDYVESLRYFHRALDEARVGSRDYLYPQILGNLAMTYYYRNDPAGIKYALDAYRIGKQRDDPYILFVGALSSAYMFYITGDYRGALRYIREAVPYANRNSAATAVHTLYGDILLELDHRDLALEHYTRAFSHTGNAQFGETAFLYSRLGEYYLRTGQPDSAIGILEEGIRFVREKNVPTYRHKLYRSLSEAYRSVGQLDKALDCYMVFHTESESLFDLERERSVNELRIAYESQMTENEHSRADRRVVVWIVSGVVVLISMVGFSFFVFRRHRKKHRASGSADERERGREIFRRLEEKMQAEGLYRDGSLTANKLAESLGTNRSYLSRAINDFAGGSFYDYVYSYRVDEAVRILTDGDNDEPLKSIAARTGFGSLNTFYVKFRQKMGTTPSEFRANRRG